MKACQLAATVGWEPPEELLTIEEYEMPAFKVHTLIHVWLALRSFQHGPRAFSQRCRKTMNPGERGAGLYCVNLTPDP